jgi:tetratricopeptide (TPR) repeat protein
MDEAIANATSEVQIEDLLNDMRLRLLLIEDADLASAGEQALARIEKEGAVDRRAALTARPPTADSELAEALEEHDDGGAGHALGPAQTALLAVACRRHARAARLGDAIAGYERLHDSGFEPEATVALVGVLKRAADAAAQDGDDEDVRRNYERLQELGAATAADAILVIAEALRIARRIKDARDYVVEHADDAADDRERMAVQRRLGALTAELEDFDAARRHFEAALSTANSLGNHAAGGQIEIRLALVARLVGDDASAIRRLEGALTCWEAAGAFDPVWSLLEEVRLLRERGRREQHWSRMASSSLDWIDEQLEARSATRDIQPI